MDELVVAMSIAQRNDGRFLILRKAGEHDEGRYAITPWEVPGGKINVGETVCGAAIRELCEETGLDGEVKQKGGPYRITREDWGKDITFFPRLIAVDKPGDIELSDEHDAYDWITVEELEDRLTDHELNAFGALGIRKRQ